MSNEVNTQLTTGLVRLSYAHIWAPRPPKKATDKPKYTCMLIIPKSDTKTVQEIIGVITHLVNGVKAVNGGKLPVGFKNPLRDADTERPDDEILRGCYFMNCSSNYAPVIVDRDPSVKISPSEQHRVYSGCWVRAGINFFVYNVESKGVGVGLNCLQFVKDDNALGGGMSATEAFSTPLEDENSTGPGDDWFN